MTSFYIVLALLVIVTVIFTTISYRRNSLFWGICAAIVAFLTTVLAILLFTGTLAQITAAITAKPTPAAVYVPSTPRPSAPGSEKIVPVESFDGKLPVNLPEGVKIVGNRAFNVCDPTTPRDGYPELQIEVLWTDGLERPETLTGLDLNRQEVGEGLYYLFLFPLGSGGHAYDADGHFTYEVHGGIHGTYVLSTAITGWCKYDENDRYEWDSGTEMHPGMVQFHPVDGDVCPESAWDWVNMPSNGKLPKPPCTGGVEVESESQAVNAEASCSQPTDNGWTWTTRDGASFWFYTGSAITFSVTSDFDQVHWFFDDGTTQNSGVAMPGESVTAVTVSAFCASK